MGLDVQLASLADEALVPGSIAERARFAELQRRLAPLFTRVFPDRHAPQTVVVVPGLSLPRTELAKLRGAIHYEERLLCLLMLLRMPAVRLVYVTSVPVQPAILDYYLHLLPGVPPGHARRRLTLLSCDDASERVLSEKILARPALLERIRSAIADPFAAHMTCFNATALERTLAVRLGIPLYACDPDLRDVGTKSGSRETFRRAGVALPDGMERLRDEADIAEALAELKRRTPGLRRAVIKLEDGFSGEGNATFSFEDAPECEALALAPHASGALARWVRDRLPERVRCEAPGERWERYAESFASMGGIVEAFLEGDRVRSPSVQCRVDPLGRAAIVSTHDQLLGGPSGQVFLGCTFPADPAYQQPIHEAAQRVAETLAAEGVLGRFAIDFLARRRGGEWEVAALEINLRKGGTTHPYLMLQFLTDGAYDPDLGLYLSRGGRPCYYHASDNLGRDGLRGLDPEELIDVAVRHDLHYDAASQQGVMFHLLGALPGHGKLGTVCIGDTPEAASRRLHEVEGVLRTIADR